MKVYNTETDSVHQIINIFFEKGNMYAFSKDFGYTSIKMENALLIIEDTDPILTIPKDD